MQHNDHSETNRFRKFFQEKGYYIVLFLCILAVGVSGYLFVSGAVSEKKALSEPTLSVATSAEIPESGTSGGKPADKPAQQSKPAASSQDTSAEASAPVTEPAAETISVRVWPVSGSTLESYSMQALSYNETTQDWRTHDGIDLSALVGEPVRAACSGTVSAVFDDEFLGTTVVISHPEGYETVYSNLAAMPAVSAGMQVTAGDTIGSVGETALLESASSPHLHFSVRQDGQSVDPAKFVD